MLPTMSSQPSAACHPIHLVPAVTLLLMLVALGCGTVQAQPSARVLRPLAQPPSVLLPIQNADIGSSEAASAAARATGGRVLSVKRAGADVYLVKVLLAGGKLRIVSIDARSGQLR